MDTFQKNRKAIAIVAGAAGVVSGIYILLKKLNKNDVDRIQIADETTSSLTVDKDAILRGIRIEYQGENLKLDTISQIFDAAIKFADPQFEKLTRRYRTERREDKRSDLQNYFYLWDEYDTNSTELIKGSEREVLKELGIPDNVWRNSHNFYKRHYTQEFKTAVLYKQQKLKLSLGSAKDLTPEEFKNVMRAHVNYTNQEADNAAAISYKIKRPEQFAGLVQNRVSDRIFQEFGVEEEDLVAPMSQSPMDPEIQQIMMQLQ